MPKQIFVLRQSATVDSDAEVVHDREYAPIECAQNRAHRNSWRLPGPITIDPVDSDDAECLWTFSSDCLINESVVEELRSSRVTGFVTDLVKLTCRHPLGRAFVQLKPSGWGGVARPESGIHLEERCASCGYSRYSPLRNSALLFNEQQWDGSDLFIIWPLPGYIFLTERAATILRDLKISGLQLDRIEHLETSGTGFRPGKLAHYFEDDRARKISKQFGLDDPEDKVSG